jgi:EAL domain-containing protein (putative c-di-GMP-specific phosphodiesterase class I)
MQPNLLDHLNGLLPLVEQHPIVIEITETDLITQMQHVTDNLDRLRAHGLLIALDDFGSGYSSIRYLARMPVDIVKFDIEMIRDLEGEVSRRSIVQNAARMVSEAGYQLIAEGIETPALQELATSMGATHLQGYLFGKPDRRPHPAAVSHAG